MALPTTAEAAPPLTAASGSRSLSATVQATFFQVPQLDELKA